MLWLWLPEDFLKVEGRLNDCTSINDRGLPAALAVARMVHKCEIYGVGLRSSAVVVGGPPAYLWRLLGLAGAAKKCH